MGAKAPSLCLRGDCKDIHYYTEVQRLLRREAGTLRETLRHYFAKPLTRQRYNTSSRVGLRALMFAKSMRLHTYC